MGRTPAAVALAAASAALLAAASVSAGPSQAPAAEPASGSRLPQYVSGAAGLAFLILGASSAVGLTLYLRRLGIDPRRVLTLAVIVIMIYSLTPRRPSPVGIEPGKPVGKGATRGPAQTGEKPVPAPSQAGSAVNSSGRMGEPAPAAPLMVAAALAGAALAALASAASASGVGPGPAARRPRPRERGGEGARPALSEVERAYEETLGLLEAAGVEVRPSMTHREVEASARAAAPRAEPALAGITSLFELVAYGGAAEGPEEIRAAEEMVETVREVLPGGGGRRRWRRWGWPWG